jgi:hypothetical protein
MDAFQAVPGQQGIKSAETEDVQILVLRAWTGGPLRQFTATKVSSAFVPFARTLNGCNFAGRYVCDACLEPCTGVSLSDVSKTSRNGWSAWQCDLCKQGRSRVYRSPQEKAAQKAALVARMGAARSVRASVQVQPSLQQ